MGSTYLFVFGKQPRKWSPLTENALNEQRFWTMFYMKQLRKGEVADISNAVGSVSNYTYVLFKKIKIKSVSSFQRLSLPGNIRGAIHYRHK